MPRRRVVEDDDDGDDDYRAPASQAPAASQATQSSALTHAEVDKKAKEVIKYLLLTNVKNVPIKRNDLTKNVIKEGSRSFSAIIEKAKKELKNVFGLDLVEIDGKSGKTYLLVSELDEEARLLQEVKNTELEKMALIMPILGLIFMSGNSVDDATLWHFLDKLGLGKEEPHFTFGSLEKFLKQEMSKEGYLQWTKIPNTDPAQFSVTWGSRAEKEVSKMDCLKFVCEVYSHKSEVVVSPKDWQVQYKEATANGEGAEEEEMEEG